MLKRITTAIAALALAAPAMATDPALLDTAHERLWDTMESKGLWAYVNQPHVCEDPEKEGINGVYFYARRAGRPILVVCQDYREGVEETVWSPNDLDTLRHEAMHYLQDCLDGEINSELRPYFDGPGGAPGEVDHAQIIEYLGPRADFIAQFYGEKLGAPAAVTRLEHEAFFVAAHIDADVIAENIQEYCPAFK